MEVMEWKFIDGDSGGVMWEGGCECLWGVVRIL